jgi:hypothetical protein
MAGEEKLSNPYVVPAVSEDSPELGVFHTDYELVGGRVICRSGLLLPEYCLVTGEAKELAIHACSIWAPGVSVAKYRSWGIGLMLTPVLLVLWMILVPSAVPWNTTVMLLVLVVPVFLVVGLVLFLLGGRRGQLCRLQGFITQRCQVTLRRIAVYSAVAMCAVLPLTFLDVVNRQVAFWAFFVPMLMLQNLLPMFFLRGLRLRAVSTPEGLFEVRGFSKRYLEKLRSLQEVSREAAASRDL